MAVRLIRRGEEPLVLVLRNPRQALDRELATAPEDAARVAVLMIARRARLEAGDLLEVSRADVDGTPLPPPRNRHG